MSDYRGIHLVPWQEASISCVCWISGLQNLSSPSGSHDEQFQTILSKTTSTSTSQRIQSRSQIRHVISPVCSGSAPESLSGWTYL